jgi:hypothetical protein
LLLLGALAAGPARAGMSDYTDRGKTDFDTVLKLLDPYGAWSKIGGLWAYTPNDHAGPYTHGRWLYTEFGWYWKGDLPHSWATEHYGYWVRDAHRVWSWFPGQYWLPQIVEIRTTANYVGWRAAAVDDDGQFVEAPADRFAKVDEWNFVTNAQFTGPITPDLLAKPDLAAKLLDDSAASTHTYVTYRVIDRAGPAPADFVALARGGGMFAPVVEKPSPALFGAPPLVAKVPAPKTVAPAAANAAQSVPARAAPSGLANPPAAPAGLAANPDGGATNAPSALSDDSDSTYYNDVDKRQVPYWITMSLPTYWTPRPRDSQPDEIYIYRPYFYQDQDGIERRIAYWVDPKNRKVATVRLQDVLEKEAAKTPNAAPAAELGIPTPAVPVPATGPGHDPFQSPFRDSFHPSATARPSAPPATNAAP